MLFDRSFICLVTLLDFLLDLSFLRETVFPLEQSQSILMCILGYNLYRKDHPLNIKRGGIFICHKISLPLKIKNIHYLQECIDFKIKITDKLCNFMTIYCSLDLCKDDFESFINKFELNLDSVRVNHPFLTLVPDDLNAKLSLWYNNKITTNNYI